MAVIENTVENFNKLMDYIYDEYGLSQGWIRYQPKPDEILLFEDDQGDGCYEEWYDVHFRIGSLYYVASDSHCSCDDYSEFEPTEFTKEAYLKYLIRHASASYHYPFSKEQLETLIKRLQEEV